MRRDTELYNASVKLTLHAEFKMSSLHHLVIIYRFMEKKKQKKEHATSTCYITIPFCQVPAVLKMSAGQLEPFQVSVRYKTIFYVVYFTIESQHHLYIGLNTKQL